jgi:hypothetical protein
LARTGRSIFYAQSPNLNGDAAPCIKEHHEAASVSSPVRALLRFVYAGLISEASPLSRRTE